MIYEHRAQPPVSRRLFFGRMFRQGGYVLALIFASELIGMAGYHWLAGAPWLDAFLNSSMLLGGMGPVGDLTNRTGKFFAAFFALYAGLVFLVATALLLTPIFHRLIHVFHWEADQAKRSPKG